MSNSLSPSNAASIPNRHRHSSSPLRRWKWAYRKIRSMNCGRLTASWHATRFAIFGETGRFFSSQGWSKLKLSSD